MTGPILNAPGSDPHQLPHHQSEVESTNLDPVTAPAILVDLTRDNLPMLRLKAVNGVVMVPAYTDLQLHTMADGPTDPNAEPLD